MFQWMARNLAGNDAIPEATLGLEIAELAEDEPRDVTAAGDQQSLPQPIKIPRPIKEKDDDSQRAKQGAEVGASGDSRGEAPDHRMEPNAEALDGMSDKPGETAPKAEQKAAEEPKKSMKQVALEELAGFSKDTFPDPTWLNPYMKEVKGRDQAEICAAYNAKKAELGL